MRRALYRCATAAAQKLIRSGFAYLPSVSLFMNSNPSKEGNSHIRRDDSEGRGFESHNMFSYAVSVKEYLNDHLAVDFAHKSDRSSMCLICIYEIRTPNTNKRFLKNKQKY